MNYFIRIFAITCETEKHIYFEWNKTNLLKEKWNIFEETILPIIKVDNAIIEENR